MTAKPKSVESLCAEFLATNGCECGNGVEPCRLCELDGKVSRILTAHRAELTEALKESVWAAVSDGLPPEGVHVLVRVDAKAGDVPGTVAHLFNGEWAVSWCRYEADSAITPTHWRPFPKGNNPALSPNGYKP